MQVWTTTVFGSCTEASTLGLRPGEPMTNAKLPDGSSGHQWVQHSRDGEVTYWTLYHQGKKYEVFNT